MAAQMLPLLPIGTSQKMLDQLKTMREHIVWLGTQLEKERESSRDKTVLLKRLLDPDDLGHAVTNEVRKQAYAIISNDHEREREKWNVSN
jgi:hypothetical protein